MDGEHRTSRAQIRLERRSFTVRIMFVISSLGLGGAQRVATTLSGLWLEAGHEVTVVTIDSAGSDFYKLDHGVGRISLDMIRASRNALQFIKNNLQRCRRLRAVIAKYRPDVVVSFLDTTNVMVLLATKGFNIPVVVSERGDPQRAPIGRVVGWLRRLSYPCATALVVPSRYVAEWGKTIVKREKVHVIPNPVLKPKARRSEGVSVRTERTVLSIGRMESEKGFDILIAAFAKCVQKHREWRLKIIGDGSRRGELAALVRKLDIEARVILGEVTKDPSTAYLDADLFVLPSRHEGFPNALVEAMAYGLPVISSNCPGGAEEIIRDGVDGILVAPDDVDALSVAMDRLMSGPVERNKLATEALEVVDRFSVTKVMGMWSDVLSQAVS
jgi:glycosyltransferase involved in cell wall biosynthesis